MNIPTSGECRQMFKEWEVPENIREHCKVVSDICQFLAGKLIEKGEKIYLELVKASAILHDLDKIKTLKTRDHTIEAYNFLKDKFPEVADVVRAHRYGNAKNLIENGTWEEKLVYYADKLVTHDKIVTFDERVEDLKLRYGSVSKDSMEFIVNGIPYIKEIEKNIFDIIGFKPEELKERMEELKNGKRLL